MAFCKKEPEVIGNSISEAPFYKMPSKYFSLHVQTKSRNSMITEEASLDLGQLRRNEVKSKPAAIHKDLETAEASTDPMNNFNQTLTSDQLLCIIYKLLTMYKPNFDGRGTRLASAASSKIQRNLSTAKSSTLRPIDNALYNLALSKTSDSLPYKPLWNYYTSHLGDAANETASGAYRTGDYSGPDNLSARRAAGILDTLPLVRIFDKYSPSLSMDPVSYTPFSASGNRAHEKFVSSSEVKARKHENQMNISRNKINDVKNQESEPTSSNITKKKLLTDLRAEIPDETLSIYLKLLAQLQEKGPLHQNEASQQSEVNAEVLPSMQHAHLLNRNHSLTIPALDFFFSYMKAHPDTIHRNYEQQLLRHFNPSAGNLNVNAASKSVSAYSDSNKSQKELFRFNDQDFNPAENFAGNPSGSSDHNGKKLSKMANKKQKQPEKKQKKFRLQIRRRSKEERKTKTHDFDFLDLLSKAMVRESKNFAGRI